MAGLLTGKVAIVTGSSAGIGRGIAVRFGREGARVVVNGRHAETVNSALEEVRATGAEAIAVVADVTQEPEVDRLFDDTLRTFGTVDVLVNNAQTPMGPGSRGPFLKMTSADWDAYVTANLGALFYCTQRAAKIMCRKRAGSIINMSTNAAMRPHRQSIAYDSVKGAMDTFTRAVAVDLAPWGVRVNGIRPGMIATTAWQRVPEEERQRRRAAIPIGREGFPEDIAWAAVFYACDDAAYVTGQAFEVDGGLIVQGRAPCAEINPVATPENLTDW